ncbi:MAG: DHH family phosphoesterase [Marinilabiliales bacterium]|nr:MAG: DHH family phosphoesterase [Marinilabiliales bacterium]
MPEKDINKLKELIVQAKKPLILTHYNPDGDAIGSALAFYHYLIKKGKEPMVVTPNDYPEFLHWMPGNDKVVVYKRNNGTVLNALKDADVIFALDFNDPDRTNGLEKYLKEASGIKVLIDHHPDPSNFADLMFSYTNYSSTAELVYHIIESLKDTELIDSVIGECLYTGIMTDTGSFNYNSSNPYTYYVVSKLIELGINKDKIYWNIYDNYSEDRMRLLGYCLFKKMEIFPEYHTALISISKKELKDFNFAPGDSEGFVNYPLSIKGIRFTAIFIENDKNVKISFRSKGEFPTNKFAEEHFNGGGHKNASGGYSYSSLEDTLDNFRKLLPNYKSLLNDSL